VWQSELFVLATDQGFLNESNVVWETLSNVEGDGHFVDAAFHTYRLPEMPSRVTPAAVSASAPPANSKEQIDHEYVTVCFVNILVTEILIYFIMQHECWIAYRNISIRYVQSTCNMQYITKFCRPSTGLLRLTTSK